MRVRLRYSPQAIKAVIRKAFIAKLNWRAEPHEFSVNSQTSYSYFSSHVLLKFPVLYPMRYEWLSPMKPKVAHVVPCVLALPSQPEANLLNQITERTREGHNKSSINVLKTQDHFSIGN